MAGVRPNTIVEHDTAVLRDAARQLEQAARLIRRQIRTANGQMNSTTRSEIVANIDAARARLA